MATQFPDFAGKLRESSKRTSSGSRGDKHPDDSKVIPFDESVQSMITAKPLAALAAALGVGFFASLAFRRAQARSESTGEIQKKKDAQKASSSKEVH